MNYTPEMEKAMQKSHRMGYADYCRKLENRMKVERRRQEDYNRSKYVVAEIESNIHR
ncbi:hypothetical protein [Ornithinibacillus halotolerans]|uniref:Uncharacterized protein n=1 Tax=Ornithinibacillus halotolerans TaxID=1274357 RepID=A0A916RYA0_9BACI|nr:hypothetical protein [Ornithinibacillus halotolerans]GGA76858.1 hypothetical protein GCM10008025_20570 [Ornithinibacillus halotolerans]